MDTNSQVVEISDDTFGAEVLDAGAPVLVDFMAQWCGPCKFMAPIFTKLAGEYAGRVKFAKMDVDASPEVAGALGIGSIPTFALFSGQTVVASGVGALPETQMRRWIDEALAHLPAPATQG